MRSVGFGNSPINPFQIQAPMTGVTPVQRQGQSGGGGVGQTGFLNSDLMSSQGGSSFTSGQGFSGMWDRQPGVDHVPIQPGFSSGIWQDQMFQMVKFGVDLVGALTGSVLESAGLVNAGNDKNQGVSQVQLYGAAGSVDGNEQIAALKESFKFPEMVQGGGLQSHITNRDLSTRQKLFTSLSLLAQDAEGSAVLQEAMKRGFTIAAGDTLDSQTKGLSLAGGDRTHIIVRDPSDVATIAQALGDVAKTGVDSSAIAQRVGQRRGVAYNHIQQQSLGFKSSFMA